MSQFWKASSVSVANGGTIVTVNTGDDVSLVSPNSFLQISNNQFVEVKTVNTGASPQTIELFEPWEAGSLTNQSAIAAPTRAEIKAAADEIRNLRAVYEGLASDVNVSAAANSIAKRDSSGRLKTATPSANEDAVNKGFLGSAATEDVTTSRTDTDGSRVMRVFDFGLGQRVAQKYPSNDLDDATVPAGFYRVVNNAPDNGSRPDGFSVFGTVLIQTYAVDTKVQIYTDIVNQKMAFRSFSATNSTPWQEIYHSGNSVNPLDYGIGGATTTNETDLNTGIYVESGITTISAAVSNMVNKPDDPSTSSRYIVTFDGALDNGVQRVTNRVTGSTWQRAFAPGGTIGDWVELYHSGNTNFNEFGGLATNDTIGVGFAASATLAVFYLPISSPTTPTGISAQSSDFSIRSPLSGSDLFNNVSVSYNTASSNKVLVVQVSGLSGLTAGQPLELQTETSDAKITVNF